MVHAGPINPHRQVQIANLVGRDVRIARVEGIVLRAQKAAFLPASGHGRYRHGRGQIAPRAQLLRDHRLHCRELNGSERLVAAAHKRHRRLVRNQLVPHRTNDGELVGMPRGHRQMFDNPHAGGHGIDGLELAAIGRSRFGFGIPAIHLANAAAQEQRMDHDRDFAARRLTARPPARACQHIAVGQASRTGSGIRPSEMRVDRSFARRSGP